MFKRCLSYISTVREVCFDCGSRYVSAVLEVFFNRARVIFRPCSQYVSTVLEISSDSRSCIFRASLELYFCHARGLVSTVLEVCFNRARGMLKPCLSCVSTVHEVYFDCRSRYASTVHVGLLRPSLEL